MANKRVCVIVEGRVQGVFFRSYTQQMAQRLGLGGWVQNRPDRSVESVVEGEQGRVDQMIQWFYQGSPMSMVTGVKVTEEEPTGEFCEFEIHYH